MKPEKKESAFSILKNKMKKTKNMDLSKSHDILGVAPVFKKRKLDDTVPVNGTGEHEESKSETSKPVTSSSTQEAEKCFNWLINPVTPERFFKDVWEKKPLLVKRHHPEYYKGLFSSKDLDRILRKENVQYSKDVDVTSYTDGKRKTLNGDGRAYASVVWDNYQNGCSIRLLSPQSYSETMWKLNSVLQEFFGSFAGANVYLTPPGSQGFAPHYDDIEAFVLQLEGKKTWNLYSPRTPSEELPRVSSSNFSQEEIGELLLTVDVEPGDLLYFPRGIIHQASTSEDTHSLHITLSTYQKNTWADLLEKLIPQALQMAIEDDVEFRRGLPCNYLDYMGVANCDLENPDRDAFLVKLQQLATKVVKYVRVDAGVDQLAKQFVHDSLPPLLSEKEKRCSIRENGERWKNGKVVNATELEPDTPVRLIRQKAVRLVMEEERIRVYHSVENSRQYHGLDPQYVEISADLAPAVEALIHCYPRYTKVEDFPLENLDSKMEIASVLYEKGLLMTKRPLLPFE